MLVLIDELTKAEATFNVHRQDVLMGRFRETADGVGKGPDSHMLYSNTKKIYIS